MYIIIIATILIFITVVLLARHSEKKLWNNGYCKQTGYPWKCFDMDSQGGRGYKDGLGNYIWISYNVDKRD